MTSMSSSLRSALSSLALLACGSSTPAPSEARKDDLVVPPMPPAPPPSAKPAPSLDETRKRDATREDCEAIADANLEIQLRAQGVIDPAAVERTRKEIREALESSGDIARCVGTHGVTDRLLRCVREAKEREELNACFR
jgi:hypothetical protein